VVWRTEPVPSTAQSASPSTHAVAAMEHPTLLTESASIPPLLFSSSLSRLLLASLRCPCRLVGGRRG
jgi:hypothetical protein